MGYARPCSLSHDEILVFDIAYLSRNAAARVHHQQQRSDIYDQKGNVWTLPTCGIPQTARRSVNCNLGIQ